MSTDSNQIINPPTDIDNSKKTKLLILCLSVAVGTGVLFIVWQFISVSSLKKEFSLTKDELVSVKASQASSSASLILIESNLKEYQKLTGQNCNEAETASTCLSRSLGKLETESELIKTSFKYPYPLSWDEQGATFSLTGVALGSISAPAGLTKTGDGFYQEGEKVNALRLAFKIAKGSKNAQCLQINFRRLLNEEGDMAVPNTTAYTFPDVRGSQFTGSCMAPDTTANNQEIIFIVPKEESDFTITTGYTSNIFFRVYKAGDVLKVEKTLKQG